MENEENRFQNKLSDFEWNDRDGNSLDQKELQPIFHNQQQVNMQESMKKYMPIGSIVHIDKQSGMYMIIGFQYEDESAKENDYMGCSYPMGISKTSSIITFQHDQIDRVYHVGFVNEQEKQFKVDLLSQNSEPKFSDFNNNK